MLGTVLSYNTFLASPICQFGVTSYGGIADACDIGQTDAVGDMMRECFEFTKSDEFFSTIRRTVKDPEALIYAVQMWHKHRGGGRRRMHPR